MDSGEELVAFLCARYFDLAAAAKAATPGPWTDAGGYEWIVEQLGYENGHMVATMEQCTEPDHVDRRREDAYFVALNDPPYVLADLAAKLQVLAEVRSWTHYNNDPDPYLSCSQAVGHWRDDSGPGSGCADEERQGKPCDCGLDRRRLAILAPLASPFSGHPEYRPEWRLT